LTLETRKEALGQKVKKKPNVTVKTCFSRIPKTTEEFCNFTYKPTISKIGEHRPVTTFLNRLYEEHFYRQEF
jgi:hypothetical protein